MPLRAAIAWRRKLSTLTPGISSGCWKPRNRPRAARSSVGSFGDVLALEPDAALGDLVGGVGEEGVGEGRLAGAVRAHQGVQLAVAHREGDAAQDLVVVDGHVEVVDLEQRFRGHGRHCISTTPVVETPDQERTAASRVSRLAVSDPSSGSGATIRPRGSPSPGTRRRRRGPCPRWPVARGRARGRPWRSSRSGPSGVRGATPA